MSDKRCSVCGSGLRAGPAPERSGADAASGEAEHGRFLCSEDGDGRRDGCVNSSDVDNAADDDTNGEDDIVEDFSVSYALRYPNEFADPALVEEDLTVGEHVDPSLYVAEPCCGVEGLEIRDHASGR